MGYFSGALSRLMVYTASRVVSSSLKNGQIWRKRQMVILVMVGCWRCFGGSCQVSGSRSCFAGRLLSTFFADPVIAWIFEVREKHEVVGFAIGDADAPLGSHGADQYSIAGTVAIPDVAGLWWEVWVG